VLAGTIAPGVVRLVTHHDVDDAGVDRAVKALMTAAR
jgi:threonine aldolase